MNGGYPEATSPLTVRLSVPARVQCAVALRTSLATPADPKSQPFVPDAPERPLSCFHSDSMRLPSGLPFQPARWLTHRQTFSSPEERVPVSGSQEAGHDSSTMPREAQRVRAIEDATAGLYPAARVPVAGTARIRIRQHQRAP